MHEGGQTLHEMDINNMEKKSITGKCNKSEFRKNDKKIQ